MKKYIYIIMALFLLNIATAFILTPSEIFLFNGTTVSNTGKNWTPQAAVTYTTDHNGVANEAIFLHNNGLSLYGLARNNKTFAIRYNFSNILSGDNQFFANYDDGSNLIYDYATANTNNLTIAEYYLGNPIFSTTKQNFTRYEWHTAIYTFNSTGFHLYIDGIKVRTDVCSNGSFRYSNTRLGIGYNGVKIQNTTVSEVCFWDEGLTQLDITEFNTYGCLGESDTTPPEITIINPANNTAVNNYPLNFIINVSDEQPTVICILKNESIILNTSTITTNIFNNLTYLNPPEYSKDTLFNITCFDNNNYTTSTYINITIDRANPTATYTSPSIYNTTIAENGTIAFNATFTDNNLIYSVNLSCNYGDFQDYRTNIDLLTFSYYNTSDFLKKGQQNCTYIYCDSHTTNQIGNYNIYTDIAKGVLSFNGLQINTDAALSDISFYKLNDRYAFCYYLADDREIITITLPKECKKVKNSKYKGHFVCSDKYWIDFEGYADVYNLGNTVTIQNIKDREICFNSIGELNCIAESFYFTTYYDSTPPEITILNPANNTQTTDYLIQISYRPIDDYSSSLNCSVTFDNIKISNETVLNNTIEQLNYTSIIGNYTLNISCLDYNLNYGEVIYYYSIIAENTINSSLTINNCPNTTSGTLTLWLIVLISLFFVGIGFVYKIGIFGFFGAIMLIIVSWYLSACLQIFAYAVALVSIFMAIWFIIKFFRI